MGDFLVDRLPAVVPVDEMLRAGEFVDQGGPPLDGVGAVPSQHVRVVPSAAGTGAGRPVRRRGAARRRAGRRGRQAALPGHHPARRARPRIGAGPAARSLGLPDLAPAHRLDRLTAGVLVLTARPRHRAAYAGLFQTGDGATRRYEALAPFDPTLEFPRRVVSRIEKRRGSLQAEVVAGEPNAETLVELVETRGRFARYRLTPTTGKTHQLRVHMAALGLPILGDPLYPTDRRRRRGRLQSPLQLIARRLRFIDPIDQTARDYTSRFALRWPEAAR